MKLIIAITLGAVCLSLQSVQATLIFSEAFNYSAGALNAANTGNVWGGGNSQLNVVNNNLTYAGIKDLGGNALQIGNGSSGSSAATFANQTSGQIYYSFLFDATAADSANNYFTAMNGTTNGVANNQNPNGGTDDIDAYLNSNGTIGLRANPDSTTSTGSPTLTYGTTYLIVEEIDLTAQTASLWVDPSSTTFNTLTPPTATLTLSGISGTSIDDVGFKSQTAAGGPYLIDNLYIGTTWADVTPTPEPSVLALAGLGLTGLVLRLRRR